MTSRDQQHELWRNVRAPRGPAQERSVYFAYGSNMDQDQMERRCPEARMIGTGRVDGFRLGFAGFNGNWGGAVATLRDAGRGHVEGVLYLVTDADLARLDQFEGAPHVYSARTVPVQVGFGRLNVIKSRVYIMRHDAGPAVPGPRYLAQIQRAYMDYGFSLKALFRAAAEGAQR